MKITLFSQYAIVMLLCSFCVSDVLASDESRRLRIIQERGTLIVGVKTDYPPWSYYNEAGEIVGLEPDLAQDIADRLNVNLQLVGVTSSNRISRLESGAIDVLIATMSDT